MLCAECSVETPLDNPACVRCGRDPRLDGRYAILEVLGRGALGTTYRATRLEDKAEVAVKELPFRRLETMKTLELCERESRVLRQLGHPGVPAYVDDFHAGEGKHSAYYLVQELIRGKTLAEEMTTRRYHEREVLTIVAELLDILTYLHGFSPPVIHRDIKLTNVMRRDTGSLVLLDFGAVRDAIKDPSLGGSTIAGTFGYMPPEQFRGVATPASDLYAVGVLAVALLTREPPEKLLDHDNKLSWIPRLAGANIATINFLKTLLEPDLDKRAADAAKARRHLDRVLGLLGPESDQPGKPAQLQKPATDREALQRVVALTEVQRASEMRMVRLQRLMTAAVVLALVAGFGFLASPLLGGLADARRYINSPSPTPKVPSKTLNQVAAGRVIGDLAANRGFACGAQQTKFAGEVKGKIRVDAAGVGAVIELAFMPDSWDPAETTCLRAELSKTTLSFPTHKDGSQILVGFRLTRGDFWEGRLRFHVAELPVITPLPVNTPGSEAQGSETNRNSDRAASQR